MLNHNPPNLIGREKDGFVIIAQKPLGNVDGDGHLTVVLAEDPSPNGEFAVWTYSAQGDYFFRGVHFTGGPNRQHRSGNALLEFARRGNVWVDGEPVQW